MTQQLVYEGSVSGRFVSDMPSFEVVPRTGIYVWRVVYKSTEGEKKVVIHFDRPKEVMQESARKWAKRRGWKVVQMQRVGETAVQKLDQLSQFATQHILQPLHYGDPYNAAK